MIDDTTTIELRQDGYEERVEPKGRDGFRPSGLADSNLDDIVRGDQDAFGKLYLHYFDPLWNFLTALLKNSEDAREMVQEVFASLWEKRASIDPGRNVKGLLYTMARNMAFNYFDHRKVVDKYNAMALHNADITIPSDELVIARETEILINVVVARMPRQRKRIFEMSRIEQLPNDQIAAMLGLSRKTVENHLTMANRELRELLVMISIFIVCLY